MDILFPFDSSRRLTTYVVNYPVDTAYIVNDFIGNVG